MVQLLVASSLLAEVGAFPFIIVIAIVFSIFSSVKKSAEKQKRAAQQAQRKANEPVFEDTATPEKPKAPQSYNDIFEQYKKKTEAAASTTVAAAPAKNPNATISAAPTVTESTITSTKSYGDIYRQQTHAAPAETELEQYRKKDDTRRATEKAVRAKEVADNAKSHSHPVEKGSAYYIEEAAEGTNSLGAFELTEGCL